MGFFDVSTGPSIAFPSIGSSAGGTITAQYTERQSTDFATDKPRVDDRGQPVMMACVPLQTTQRDPSIPGDDGIRTLYVDKVGMKIAIGEAIKKSGAADLEIGATLNVTWTGEAPSSKGNPLKTWSATYTRPVGSLGKAAANAAVVAENLPKPPAADADLVAMARAAQEKIKAEQAALEAKAAAVPPAGQVTNGNGAADPMADFLKIRQLSGMGIEPEAIHAVMPHFTMAMINAALVA